jgi:hypothetical protein
MTVTKKRQVAKPKTRRKNPVVAKKPLTKEFISHAGYIKAVYHASIEMWKLYKRHGNLWKLLGAVRGTAKTTDKQLIAKLPPGKRQIAKKPVRKKNPLKKYVCYVGPEFPDTEQGKSDCLAFAQRFANKYGVVAHVYKA